MIGTRRRGITLCWRNCRVRDRGLALALVLGVMLNLSGAVLCYTLSKMCRLND